MKNKEDFLHFVESFQNSEGILKNFIKFLVLSPFQSEENFIDLNFLKNSLKGNKEKSRNLLEYLAKNLKKYIVYLKNLEKEKKHLEKEKFLKFFPLNKLVLFIEELIQTSEANYYPIFKVISSNLMIFFSYFGNENNDLIYKLICDLFELTNFGISSFDNLKAFMIKYIEITFKPKRMILFHLLFKYLFENFHTTKINGNEPLPFFEAFFEAISNELKNMNKFEINLDKGEKLRNKMIFICDLITRFTHQLDMNGFYTVDMSIRKLIKIEEIFTIPVK